MSSRPNQDWLRSFADFFLAMSVGRPAARDVEHRARRKRTVLGGEPAYQGGDLVDRHEAVHRNLGEHIVDVLAGHLVEDRGLCRGAFDRGRIRNVDRVFLCGELPQPDGCAGTLEAPGDRGADPLQTPGDDGGAALEIELVHSFTAPVMPET